MIGCSLHPAWEGAVENHHPSLLSPPLSLYLSPPSLSLSRVYFRITVFGGTFVLSKVLQHVSRRTVARAAPLLHCTVAVRNRTRNRIIRVCISVVARSRTCCSCAPFWCASGSSGGSDAAVYVFAPQHPEFEIVGGLMNAMTPSIGSAQMSACMNEINIEHALPRERGH